MFFSPMGEVLPFWALWGPVSVLTPWGTCHIMWLFFQDTDNYSYFMIYFVAEHRRNTREYRCLSALQQAAETPLWQVWVASLFPIVPFSFMWKTPLSLKFFPLGFQGLILSATVLMDVWFFLSKNLHGNAQYMKGLQRSSL